MIFEPVHYDANRVLDCIKACEGMANPTKEIVALRAEMERKDKALAWYADHKNYVGDGSMVRIGNSLQTFKPILADHGGMARAALRAEVARLRIENDILDNECTKRQLVLFATEKAVTQLREALKSIEEVEQSFCYEAYPESNPGGTAMTYLRACGNLARAALAPVVDEKSH